MHQSLLSMVASSNSGESVIGVVIFAAAAFWFYMKMDKRDKDHEIKMKKLRKKK
jgi:hypothetical protein